jgi:hypothetical protein
MEDFDFSQTVARIRLLLDYDTPLDVIHAKVVENGATPDIAHLLIVAAGVHRSPRQRRPTVTTNRHV